MTATAVWTGLATVLTAILGGALASLSGGTPSLSQWLLTGLFGLAVVEAPMSAFIPGNAEESRRRRGPQSIVNGVAVMIVSGTALVLLGIRAGSWFVPVTGAVTTLLVVAASELVGPRLRWPPATVGMVAIGGFLSLVLPVVAYAASRARPLDFPWAALPGLLLLALPLAAALGSRSRARVSPERKGRADRLVVIAMVVSSALGLVLTATLFPGTWEHRLLGVSAAVVVTLTGAGAMLHPDVAEGRRLAGLLSSITYCAATAGLAVVYLFA